MHRRRESELPLPLAREIVVEESLEERGVAVRDDENREIGKVPIEPNHG
jgi:hypothetical protein